MAKLSYEVETNLITEETLIAIQETSGAVEKEICHFIQIEDELYSRCIVNAGTDFERRDSLKEEFNKNILRRISDLIEAGYSNK